VDLEGSSAFGHVLGQSRFGEFALVWGGGGGESVVQRVVLPSSDLSERLAASSTEWETGAGARMLAVVRSIERFLEGEDVTFTLDDVALGSCATFQRRVLVAEHAIPRGSVASYGSIAAHLRAPGAARAVGRALATNPFPIIVPCHRAIRGDRSLGGYQGGVAMKRALLEYEGVEVSADGRVVAPRMFY
jgi:methylated-DNA-[protein]-cysteine S-methyltransferase